MKKALAIVLASLLLACAMAACAAAGVGSGGSVVANAEENSPVRSDSGNAANAASENPESVTPTGYTDGKLQQPFLYYNGVTYAYYANECLDALPNDAELIGTVASIDNDNMPSEDFAAARMEVGMEIYKGRDASLLYAVRREDRIEVLEVYAG